jgi:hypothetical protein
MATKPFKLRDATGLRDHTGQYSLSGKPAPGKMPDPPAAVAPTKVYPGYPPGEVKRDPGPDGETPLKPPAKEAPKKSYRLRG